MPSPFSFASVMARSRVSYQVRSIIVSALPLDQLLGELHHGWVRFGIRQIFKDRPGVVDVALLEQGLGDQTALGRAQGDGAFSLGNHYP